MQLPFKFQLQFNQSAWSKQYADFNTNKRTNAKSSFEKDFFKLMNNSVFDKTMQNVGNRVYVKLVTDEKNYQNIARRHSLVPSKIFIENLIAIYKIKESITL